MHGFAGCWTWHVCLCTYGDYLSLFLSRFHPIREPHSLIPDVTAVDLTSRPWPQARHLKTLVALCDMADPRKDGTCSCAGGRSGDDCTGGDAG